MCERAQSSPVPVSVMLDHGKTFEDCMQMLSCGATDVMFDGGNLPLEENVDITRMVVKAAHAMGAGAEAELGWVGSGKDYENPEIVRQGFTKPEEAAQFVEDTGVDALAVAIGSAHGVYHGKPELALDLLADIRERIDTPLVLHGGSGIDDEQFRQAIKAGICKINIFTALNQAAARKVVAATQKEDVSYFSINAATQTAFTEECKFFLDLFGASGKAD
jgi:fructose-bisphosphate aldolase, class II